MTPESLAVLEKTTGNNFKEIFAKVESEFKSLLDAHKLVPV